MDKHSGYKTIITKDGSKTFISPLFEETYHSIHGAIQESNHVFIESGLNFYLENSNKSAASILEIGFGTGLNCLLSYRFSQEKSIHIKYTGVEHYPIGIEKAAEMDFPFQNLDEKDFFLKIHDFNDKESFLFKNKNFEFISNPSKFEDLSYNEKFDLIYFDAFAPSRQPHLWESEFLEILFKALNPNGVLVTYGSKGSFKRALKSLGFTVQSIPGPPGKREMTRAIK